MAAIVGLIREVYCRLSSRIEFSCGIVVVNYHFASELVEFMKYGGDFQCCEGRWSACAAFEVLCHELDMENCWAPELRGKFTGDEHGTGGVIGAQLVAFRDCVLLWFPWRTIFLNNA